MNRKNKYKMLKPYLFLLPAILWITIFMFYPVTQGFKLSLSNFSPVRPEQSTVRTMDNYIRIVHELLFGQKILLKVFIRTYGYACAVVSGHLVIGMSMALFLYRGSFIKKILRSFALFPFLVPWIVVAMIFAFIYNPFLGPIPYLIEKFGISNTPIDILGTPKLALLGVILASIWCGFPLSMLLLIGGLQSLDPNLSDAARIDGANYLQEFVFVVLPQLLRIILTIVLFDMLIYSNMFSIIWGMTRGGPLLATEVNSTYIYKVAFFEWDFGYSSALSIFVLLSAVTLSTIYAKRVKIVKAAGEE